MSIRDDIDATLDLNQGKWLSAADIALYMRTYRNLSHSTAAVASQLWYMRKRGQVSFEAGRSANGRREYLHHELLPSAVPPPKPVAIETAPLTQSSTQNEPILSLADLADSLATRVLDALMPMIGESLKAQLPGRIEKAVRTIQALPEQVSKPRLPKVLVVGLLPQQAGFIATEFGELFDLSFWKDGQPDTLKALARHADKVIVMTGWVSHYHLDLIRAAHADFEAVGGGMSTLRDSLETYYAGL